MKLITLNTFGGHFFAPLMEFVKSSAPSTDFFCFQEVSDAPGGIFSDLAVALPEFLGFFAAAQEHFDGKAAVAVEINFGLAAFARKDYAIKKTGDFFIKNRRNSFLSPDFTTFPHNLQYLQLNIGGKELTICNLHGSSQPTDKLDSPGRLAQSKKILNFIQNQPGEKIITGDFNLLPGTRSMAMFEERGFRNLIKDFSIPTTRGSLIKKLHPEYGASAQGWQEFADYTLVSPGISARKFVVPDLPLSDHLPLILEFAIA